MITVLRIINRFNLGGPTYNVAYLTRHMPSDFRTVLVGGAKDDSEESSEFITSSLGLSPVIIAEMKRKISLKDDLAAYRRIKQLILEHKPDIVHTHASKAGALGRLAAHACGVPVIVHTFHGHVFHSYFGKATTLFYKTLERFLARRSTAIIAISELQKDELTHVHRICEPSKITVIPLGFDLSRFAEGQEEKRRRFRARYFVGDDEIVISIIGRIVPVKDHPLFLSAMKIVKERTQRNVRAMIIGDGEARKQTEEFATAAGLSHSADPKDRSFVTFTSWIREIDVALAGSDIIALTSFNEGTPVSLIEAQAASRPVVSVAVGGIGDIVTEGETALLCRSRDPEELAELLLRLTENDALRARMSQSGKDLVMKKFHYTRLVSDVEALYRRLLKKS